MPVNSTHPDCDAAATVWSRARDVLAGEDAVKAGGEKYLPRLDCQTDEEFAAYVKRASFFNASARTSEAYLGLMFRRPPFVKLPADGAGVGRAMAVFQNDADMLGTTLTGYAKVVVGDVVGLCRGLSCLFCWRPVEWSVWDTSTATPRRLSWSASPHRRRANR